MPDEKRFFRQLGRRLSEIQRDRGWEKADFAGMGYNYDSWERHRRGNDGMSTATALGLSKLCGETLRGLFAGTDHGIYQKPVAVVRKRPYRPRNDLNAAAEKNFRVRLTACLSSEEHGKAGMTVDEFHIRFGWRIRRLRMERGWSLGDMGKGNTWQHWESGRRCPKISTWVGVCEILEIDLDRLLRGIETEGDELISAFR